MTVLLCHWQGNTKHGLAMDTQTWDPGNDKVGRWLLSSFELDVMTGVLNESLVLRIAQDFLHPFISTSIN